GEYAYGCKLRAMKVCAPAPLTDHVRPEPVVELITDAEIEQRGTIEAHAGRCEESSVGITGIVELLEVLVGHADVAAQIPAAEFLDRGRRVHRRRRDGEVCGKRRRRQQ